MSLCSQHIHHVIEEIDTHIIIINKINAKIYCCVYQSNRFIQSEVFSIALGGHREKGKMKEDLGVGRKNGEYF